MSTQWFSVAAFIVAVVLGYTVIATRNDDGVSIPAPVIAGYYLKDATIVETGKDGAPRIRIAAVDVQQDMRDNTMQLQTVKADYFTTPTADTASTHWVMDAAQGRMPAKSDIVKLSGGVTTYTVDSERAVTFTTSALDINTKLQTARTDQAVDIDVAEHRITGHGLTADLPREHLQLSGRGEVRLAENAPRQVDVAGDAKISLPGIFDHEGLELRDGGIRLTKVRSKTPPLVQADEAVASNTDLDNNRFTLRGNVEIDLPEQGKVQADSAIVTVRNSRIVHATASGEAPSQANAKPVRFEHRRKTQNKQTNEVGTETAHGHAQTIDYDVLTNLVVFTDNVWFSTGRFEWRGEEWQYNLTDGSGSTTRRSTTTVLPRPSADAGGKQ